MCISCLPLYFYGKDNSLVSYSQFEVLQEKKKTKQKNKQRTKKKKKKKKKKKNKKNKFMVSSSRAKLFHPNSLYSEERVTSFVVPDTTGFEFDRTECNCPIQDLKFFIKLEFEFGHHIYS